MNPERGLAVLKTLDIRNLATVESLTVDFGPGLNVVTGETGAGKSIILGAIQILLGERAEKTIIRHGCDACDIAATIELSPTRPDIATAVQAILDEAGLPAGDDDTLLLRRVVTANNTRAYVNCTPVTLRVMKALGDLLVDIHGPHDHQSLLSPRCQIDLLDAFAHNQAELSAVAEADTEVRQLATRLDQLRSETLAPADAELLRHQLREIDDAGLTPEEEEQLAERHRLAAHARRLLELATACTAGLAEAEGSIADRLGLFVRRLQELAEIAPSAGDGFLARLEECIENVRDLALDIGRFAESLELDEEEFARLEERLDLIHDLKRKHRATLDELLAKAEQLRQRLTIDDHREEHLADLEKQLRLGRQRQLEACHQLTRHRRQAADQLAAAIADKLAGLGFASSRFALTMTTGEPGPNGSDRVEFCFAPNPGQDLMPLRKIASSGEMARVMLAIKTVLTAADRVPLLIFDEVDANVGGRIAGRVAAELAAVADQHQVLCITHLPQIAAAASRHFLVGKKIDGNHTRTTMHPLDHDARVAELVRMMGSAADSTTAQAHAEELLAAAAVC